MTWALLLTLLVFSSFPLLYDYDIALGLKKNFIVLENQTNFVIDGEGTITKNITFYGLSNDTVIKIFSSSLYDVDTNKVVESDKIRFGNGSGKDILLDDGEFVTIPITIKNVSNGYYFGKIYFQSNNTNDVGVMTHSTF